MRKVEPKIPCALLIAGESMGHWPEMRTKAIALGALGVSIFYPSVNERIVEECRRSGLSLYTWTPDSRKEIARLAKLGVDGICSNFPDKVIDVLQYPRPG
jgi:glycerophosphoryl diester phosphodiesterase